MNRMLGYLIPVVGLTGYAIWRGQRLKQAAVLKCFENQALKRSANIKPGNFLYYPVLTIHAKHGDIIVSAQDTGSGSRGQSATSAAFYTDFFPEYVLFIRSKSVEGLLEKIVTGQGMTFNNPALDSMLLARTNKEDLSRRLLTLQIQTKLLRFDLRTLFLSFEKIRFFDGQQWVQKPRFLVSIQGIIAKDDTVYDDLIETAVIVQGQLNSLISPS